MPVCSYSGATATTAARAWPLKETWSPRRPGRTGCCALLGVLSGQPQGDITGQFSRTYNAERGEDLDCTRRPAYQLTLAFSIAQYVVWIRGRMPDSKVQISISRNIYVRTRTAPALLVLSRRPSLATSAHRTTRSLSDETVLRNRSIWPSSNRET